jgi:hypothetical protein
MTLQFITFDKKKIPVAKLSFRKVIFVFNPEPTSIYYFRVAWHFPGKQLPYVPDCTFTYVLSWNSVLCFHLLLRFSHKIHFPARSDFVLGIEILSAFCYFSISWSAALSFLAQSIIRN